jgi:phosphonate transport system substrate-binding protein
MMALPIPKTLLAIGLAPVMLLAVSVAAAEEPCPRGDLDERFCDLDGDMLADPPTDPSQWLDPDTLIFTYAPTEDPAVYQDAFSEFMDYLAEMTGKEVIYFPVRSYAAQIEAMRAGRLHVSGFAAGAVQEAVNSSGFIPVAMMASQDGSYGYQMQIIAHQDSDIHTLEDLRGRELAFVSPTSNSGFKAPSALLYAEFEMLPDVDYQTTFSGGHDNSILGVYHHDYEAAAIASTVLDRMVARGVLDRDQLRFTYESQPFPSTGYGYVYNLAPELAEKVREAFLTFDWEGTKLDAEFGDVDTFMEINYQEDWAVLRQIAAASAAIFDE